jgi:predicted nucleic acid-binding Zn ribbon protein
MPLYEYETVPQSADTSVQRFSWRQRFSDPPLVRHPDTDEPVRRLITGGSGLLLPSRSGSAAAAALAAEFEAAANHPPGTDAPDASDATDGCGRGCGCAVS